MKTLEDTDPAPGSPYIYVCPSNTLIVGQCLKALFQADANAADRYVQLQFCEPSGVPYLTSPLSPPITAGQAFFIYIADFPAIYYDPINFFIHIPFPFQFQVPSLYRLILTVYNMQATDTILKPTLSYYEIPFDTA
jgi:hypothetical protein